MRVNKKAVHFGAGNIGRGFVGQVLGASGYEVVFADVNAALVEQLNAAESYVVHEVGDAEADVRVTGFRAIDSRLDEARAVYEIATADVLTTSVGPRILPSLAPLIARGLCVRDADLPPLTVVACETAIGASSTLAEIVTRTADSLRAAELPDLAVAEFDGPALVAARAVFANCEIDRIVPEQTPGLDVTIESFAEWAIETGPFEGRVAPPHIEGVTWVEDLAPFIERKLFTVNTAHAAAAYYGWARGIGSVRDALEVPEIHAEVLAVLAETKSLLVAKYGIADSVQQAYIDRNLARIANPHLPDTTGRVGRNPLSKLSRHERLVGPAAQLAERGLPFDALVRVVRAALDFDVPDDVESRELQGLLRSGSRTGAGGELLAETITGVYPGHPLFPALAAVVTEKMTSRVAA